MTAFDRQVRAQIYRLFGDGMTVVDGAAMAESRGWVAEEVEASLDRLAEAHLIKLAEGSHRVEMAHPFGYEHRLSNCRRRSIMERELCLGRPRPPCPHGRWRGVCSGGRWRPGLDGGRRQGVT